MKHRRLALGPPGDRSMKHPGELLGRQMQDVIYRFSGNLFGITWGSPRMSVYVLSTGVARWGSNGSLDRGNLESKEACWTRHST